VENKRHNEINVCWQLQAVSSAVRAHAPTWIPGAGDVRSVKCATQTQCKVSLITLLLTALTVAHTTLFRMVGSIKMDWKRAAEKLRKRTKHVNQGSLSPG
jgi:hypothetical protein